MTHWHGLVAGIELGSVYSLDQQLFWVCSYLGGSEEQKRPNQASTFKTSAHITSAKSSLAKPSHMARPKVRDGEVPTVKSWVTQGCVFLLRGKAKIWDQWSNQHESSLGKSWDLESHWWWFESQLCPDQGSLPLWASAATSIDWGGYLSARIPMWLNNHK